MKKAVLLCAALLAMVSCGKPKPKPKPRTYDRGVSKNLGYTGSIKVESISDELSLTTNLLEEFNRYTNSTVDFQVVETQNLNAYISPTNMPDVLSIDSQNILEYLKFGAISFVKDSDVSWINKYHDDSVRNEVHYYNKYRGYPYSISPTLMIYNKSLVSLDEIDTVDKLFTAAETNHIDVISQLKTHPFYANGVLETYNNEESFYQLHPTSEILYTATSSYNCNEGLNGAKLLRRIFKEARFTDSDNVTTPRLATFAEQYNIRRTLRFLGNDYNIAALPKVDESSNRRIGSSTLISLYCVNNTKTEQTKNIANDVAKFLSSEYSQLERFKFDGTIPSVKTLEKETKDGDFVKAFNEQKASNSIKMLGVVENIFWNGINVACNDINNLYNPNDESYRVVLQNLDAYLTVTQ